MTQARLPSLSQELLAALKDAGLKRTHPRASVLEVLASGHGPFTTEEVRASVQGGKLDLVTVYRTLASFEKAGLARRCDFGDGVARYELSVGEHHHHHVICRVCRKAEALEGCAPALDRLEKIVLKLGYTVISHSLEFFGVCRECSK